MSGQLLGEALLVGCIAAVGASALRLTVPRLGPPLTLMFSGLVGVLVITLTSVITLGLGTANSTRNVVVLSVVVLATSLIVATKRSSLRSDLLVIAGSALVGSVVTVGIGLLVAPILTFDSWRFLEHGSSVFGDGAGLDLLLENVLGNYPIALTSLQGLARGFGLSFLASGAAAIGVMGIAGAFDLFGRPLVGPRQGLRLVLLVVAIVGVVMSAYITRLQLGYVNSHAMTAGFYSIGIAAIFAPGTEETSSSPIDESLRAVILGISCAGLALGRVEGLIIVSLVLIAAVTYRGWSRRSVGIIALTGIAAPAIWYGRLSMTLIEADILSPTRMAILLLVATGPLLLAVISKPSQPIQWLAPVTLLVLGGAALVVARTNPEGMGTSVSNLVLNLISMGLWGAFWWVVIPLSIMAVWRIRQQSARGGWLVVTLGFVLVVMLLGGVRDFPYVARWGDSGNRMMFHVLPAFFLLIVAGFGGADEDTNVVPTSREAV